MGIVNITPDSFSDGGKFFAIESALDHARRLAAEGADLIDIGGESTRPYSAPVNQAEEMRRVVPVIERLAGEISVPISIDTSKAAVAEAAVAAGAEIINDVTGLAGDPQMLAVAARTRVGVCAMHMQGTPQSMQDNPRYENVVEEIHAYLSARRDQLTSSGIERERIALDPGIGFGKTHDHNLALAANCRRFLDLGCPVLVGHSRKGFIGKLLGDKDLDRTFGSLGVSLALAVAGVHLLRVHDVAATRQALTLFGAVAGWPQD